MEKYLRPERFNVNLNQATASKEWLHWYRTLQNFYAAAETEPNDKLNMLINFVSPNVYEYIADCASFDKAIIVLTTLYVCKAEK